MFELIPVLDQMIELYEKPRSIERFKEYIDLLQGGTKGVLKLPIGGYNPMAKEHITAKLQELKQLRAEDIAREALRDINSALQKPFASFNVVLNLSDDAHGGWTNRYTSDYDSKFKLNALIARGFCTPVFWSSENYSEQLIRERVLSYAYRTLYRSANPQPKNLQEHLLQEKFVCEHMPGTVVADVSSLNDYYHQQKLSTDNTVIFNFLYGDEASQSLGTKAYGVKQAFAGYAFARYVADKGFEL